MTKEYRRLAEFCDACRRHRYIGLCYGPPGVGTTISGRHYTHWDALEPIVNGFRILAGQARRPETAESRTVFDN